MRLVDKVTREIRRLFSRSKRSARRGAANRRAAAVVDPCPVDERQLLTAILLPIVGRNGSTLTMQLLGTAPEIAFDRSYPFEVRYLTYLWRLTDVMLRKYAVHPRWNNEMMVNPDLHEDVVYVGPISWCARKMVAHPQASIPFDRRCLNSLWREFTATVREHTLLTSPDSPPPRFYAEKTTPTVLESVRAAIPVKSIYLVRDPRDVWISANRFNERRGYNSFGRQADDSDQDYLHRFIDTRVAEMQLLQSVRNDEHKLIVQYEDLASDLAGQARRIGDWLGVELRPELVEKQRDSFQHHITSGSAENSVTRWKRELPDEINRQFVERLGPELEHFGYKAA